MPSAETPVSAIAFCLFLSLSVCRTHGLSLAENRRNQLPALSALWVNGQMRWITYAMLTMTLRFCRVMRADGIVIVLTPIWLWMTVWERLNDVFIRVYYDAILLCIAGGLILEMNILLSAGSNTFDLNYIWSICNWSAYVCNRCGYFILSKQRWLVKEPKRAFVSVHTQILALNTHWAHPQAPSNHSFINKLIAYSHE